MKYLKKFNENMYFITELQGFCNDYLVNLIDLDFRIHCSNDSDNICSISIAKLKKGINSGQYISEIFFIMILKTHLFHLFRCYKINIRLLIIMVMVENLCLSNSLIAD